MSKIYSLTILCPQIRCGIHSLKVEDTTNKTIERNQTGYIFDNNYIIAIEWQNGSYKIIEVPFNSARGREFISIWDQLLKMTPEERNVLMKVIMQ